MAAKNGQEGQAYDVKGAAKYLGVTPARVRALLRDGRLHTVEREIAGVAGATIKVITQDELDSYRAARMDRRNSDTKAYVVRLTPEQHDALVAQGFTLEPRYQHDPVKAKAYRQRRNAVATLDT